MVSTGIRIAICDQGTELPQWCSGSPHDAKLGPTGTESGLTGRNSSCVFQQVMEQILGEQSDFFIIISEVQAEDGKQDSHFHAYLQMQALNFH